MRRHLLISILFLALLFALLPAQAQQSTNLLQNPDFEGQFIVVGGDSTLQVAAGWQAWHLPPPAGAPNSVNLRPDYQSAPPNRIRTGSGAQQYDTFFATHTGGILQTVSVTQGNRLQFSAFVYLYSSASFEDIDNSVDPQGLSVSLGIDPNGGTNGNSPSIIWSTAQEYYDEYREVSVTTNALSNTVTVFVRTTVNNAPGLHQVFVDDAVLVVVPSDSTPTTPTDTVTPVETVTTTPDASITVTTTATTATATRTATPRPTTVTPTRTTTATVAPTRTPYSDDFPNELAYLVTYGDTVIGLAIRYDSTVDAIIGYNGLSASGLIFIGQTLLIPVRAGIGSPVIAPTPTLTPLPPSPATPTDGGTGGQTGGQGGVYVVQVGDTLFSIARRFNTTAETLAAYNNILNPHRIQAGQVLLIPTPGSQPSPAQPVPAQPVPAQPLPQQPPVTAPRIHIVQPGENLFRIGLRYNMTVDVLARANNLFNPNIIFVGQPIIIP